MHLAPGLVRSVPKVRLFGNRRAHRTVTFADRPISRSVLKELGRNWQPWGLFRVLRIAAYREDGDADDKRSADLPFLQAIACL
ncbi:hypothetical protein LMG28690_05382 [Paraburkholderia caffeinilytica]|nr:hypothetical protein LMG28690_05382 [Paraburkholderia caffeinilytica]